jgi:hypothetical protein
MAQLEAVFGGDISSWQVFGWYPPSLRRYGLPADTPVMELLEAKLPSARDKFLVRKRDPEDLFSTLAREPDGIGVVDATAAVSAGSLVKKLGVDGVMPNAQTLKDGSYPLTQPLTFYVTSNAAAGAREFAQFILSGRGNSVFWKYGIMPALSKTSPDSGAGIYGLYGSDIERVKNTSEVEDDIAMAEKLVQSVRNRDLGRDSVIAMCEEAIELTAAVPGGEVTAFEALYLLWDEAPGQRFDIAERRAKLYRDVFEADDSRFNGEKLVEALIFAAETGTEFRRYSEAARLWRRAHVMASRCRSAKLQLIERRLSAFKARAKSMEDVQALASRFEREPEDDELRRRLMHLYLAEVDDVNAAARLVRAVDTEEMKTNIPLAVEPVENLSEVAALRLAEWYVGMMERADVGGRELMAERAKKYYYRFASLHTARDDGMAERAELDMEMLGANMPSASWAKYMLSKLNIIERPELSEPFSDLELAEFVARNKEITSLGSGQVGGAQHITDLSPLEYLEDLRGLTLTQVNNVDDLSFLNSLRNLERLTLKGLKVRDCSIIGRLTGLSYLNLSGAESLADLRFLARLSGLRTLILSNCPMISDLMPLTELEDIRSLDISGCQKVVDLVPLEQLAGSLTSLNLNGCNGVKDIYPLWKCADLKGLDLRNCSAVPSEDVKWLKRQLPDCRILHD